MGANDVELYSVPDDGARNLIIESPNEPFQGGYPNLPNSPTLDADSVVVVFDK